MYAEHRKISTNGKIWFRLKRTILYRFKKVNFQSILMGQPSLDQFENYIRISTLSSCKNSLLLYVNDLCERKDPIIGQLHEELCENRLSPSSPVGSELYIRFHRDCPGTKTISINNLLYRTKNHFDNGTVVQRVEFANRNTRAYRCSPITRLANSIPKRAK